MDLHLFRLHLSVARRLPSAFQAVLAPLQTLHWRVLERRLQSRGTTSLEAIVRPALLPTEQWSDVADWRSNLRLLAWLRAAHLRAKPRVQEQLPAARAEKRARLVDPTLPPPSMAKCRELFGLTYPSGGARQPGLPRAAARAGAPKPTTQQRTGSTRDVPFEAVLEASGGLVAHRGAWAAFAEEHGMYELVSRELVEALAAYIVARAPSLCASDGSDTLRILECGAGNGELSHHMRQALLDSRVDATLMANDNGSWPLPDGLQFEGVQPISYRAALRQHAPHLVLSSWMPMGVDCKLPRPINVTEPRPP